ncbi:MAG: T9SS type A sorting domain-containing protein [Crocinitomicaceae bacterium]
MFRLILSILFLSTVSFSGKSQTLNVFMTTTDETTYGACDGTITMWVEGASAADSFMFLLDVAPAPVVYDSIIVIDTIITVTNLCPGDYTVTLDTLWGSCPNYGGGCCNCTGSTACGGAPGGGATGTIGAAASDLDGVLTVNYPVCIDGFGDVSLTINGNAPPFFYAVSGTNNWIGPYLSGQSIFINSLFCGNVYNTSFDVRDASGQVVSAIASGNAYTGTYGAGHCIEYPDIAPMPDIDVCAGESSSFDLSAYFLDPSSMYSSLTFIIQSSNPNVGVFSNQVFALVSSNSAFETYYFTASPVTSVQTSIITVSANVPSGINNCFQPEQSFILTVYPAPLIDAGADQAVCQGDQVTLTGSGNGNLSWDNSILDNVPFTPTATSTYELTVIDSNGCQNSDQVDVIVNLLPTIDGGVDQTVCDGDQVTLSGSGGTSYVWDNGISNNVSFTPALGTTTYQVSGTDANGCQNADQVDVIMNLLPTIDGGIDQTVCDGDQVTLSGSGGSSYAWNNGVSDNISFTPVSGTTTYQVTGTDANGCQNSDQVDVIVNLLPTIDAGADQAVCQGDQVTLTGSGNGNLSWDNSVLDNVPFTPTATSTYELTVIDSNGCQNSDQVDVIVNSLPIIDAGADQNVCEGDQVTLSGSGGSSYAWNNGISDNVAFTPAIGTTTYQVTGTDANNCQNTDQVNVVVNSLPIIDAGSDTIVCFGDSILLVALSSDSVTWTGGLSNLDYYVPAGTQNELIATATNVQGCQNSDTMMVTQSNAINTTLSILNLSDITAFAGYANYEWQFCQSSVTVQNGPANVFTATQDGNYKVVISNSDNCFDTSECLIIDYLDLTETSIDNQIYLAPNPTAGKIQLITNLEVELVQVYDMFGRIVLSQSGGLNEIDLTEYESGTYLVEIRTKSGGQLQRRIVKQE